jgi:hypothetical protein
MNDIFPNFVWRSHALIFLPFGMTIFKKCP